MGDPGSSSHDHIVLDLRCQEWTMSMVEGPGQDAAGQREISCYSERRAI